jgi:hypothetical protein
MSDLIGGGTHFGSFFRHAPLLGFATAVAREAARSCQPLVMALLLFGNAPVAVLIGSSRGVIAHFANHAHLCLA